MCVLEEYISGWVSGCCTPVEAQHNTNTASVMLHSFDTDLNKSVIKQQQKNTLMQLISVLLKNNNSFHSY